MIGSESPVHLMLMNAYNLTFIHNIFRIIEKEVTVNRAFLRQFFFFIPKFIVSNNTPFKDRLFSGLG